MLTGKGLSRVLSPFLSHSGPLSCGDATTIANALVGGPGWLAHMIETRLAARPEVLARDTDTAAHLVVQTVEALTHRFVHHGIHDLGREAFIDEVVALLGTYLTRKL